MSDSLASRRDFLRSAAGAGGGLILGLALPRANRLSAAAPNVDAAAASGGAAVNAFVKISRDDRVTLIMPKSEMGQGVYTGLSQLLAEELGCDLAAVRIETAPVAPAYNHPVFPMQFTGGSMSISSCWTSMRMAGAAARMMLLRAAADRWQIAADACWVEHGAVHGPGGRKATFGGLADAAGNLSPPDPATVTLKPRDQFTVIGKPVKRIEAAEKVDGSGIFGLDVRLPGMLRAVLVRPPALGSLPVRIDDTAARAVPGVVDVKVIQAGVAVVARNTHAARLGRDALKIDWQAAPDAVLDTEQLRADYRRRSLTDAALVARNDGDAAAKLRGGGATNLEAFYEVPYLSHAPMEPMNCVADLRADRCDVWTGTQMQSVDRAAAAEVAGLAPEQVFIHTTLLGGGFGRRANPGSDFVREAVELSNAIKAPVQVVWTREDDMHGGWYRPLWLNRLRAALGADGRPVAWHHTFVGQSIMAGTPMQAMIKDGIDPASVEGAADLPYAIPNVRVDLHTTSAPVRVQWWRSVGHSNTAFAVESFIDECAFAASLDPLDYRCSLLGEAQKRRRAVLETLAEKAGWGRPLPAGRARGMAIHESFGSVVGEAAEVSMEGGLPRVHRVVAVIDCGFAVNPQMIEAQLESAINYGLSAALYGEITFAEGKPQQANFDTYPVIRMSEAPRVEAPSCRARRRPPAWASPDCRRSRPRYAMRSSRSLKRGHGACR